MSRPFGHLFFWRVLSVIRSLPVIRFFIMEWQLWCKEQEKPHYRLASMPRDASELPPYPLDMWPLLALPLGTLDEVGVPYNAPTEKYPAVYHPTTIAQYALAHWNTYLATGDEKHREAFMTQAHWLVDHETPLTSDMGGWPIPFDVPNYHASGPWLSAMTQGEGISVLVRAYRLSSENVFLQVARRAIRTFELDIRDGGVSTSIDGDGVFFEEVAVYPAAHILNGYLFAVFGLYDYVTLTDDARIAALIKRSLFTMHTLIDRFDTGYWSHYELLFGRMASQFYHSLHVLQLKALARYSGCEHCAALAGRWAGYQRSRISQVRYFVASRIASRGFVVRWIACYRHGLDRVFSSLSSTGGVNRT